MKVYTLEDVKNKVVIIDKDLSKDNYKTFEKELNHYIENDIKNIILSFKNIRYVPSKTIVFLANTEVILRKRGGGVIITDINEYIKWVLISTDHYQTFKKTKNIDNALCLIRV